jgi:hypothetical protein
MATTNIGFSVSVESTDATKSIKELKSEIELTTKAVEDLGAKYGQNSAEVEAAQKRLANLQDLTNQKQEQNNERLDNAAKTVSALSAAYGGVQGALELTGLAGEDTIKQLAKIQSALAIGDAVQNLAEFRGAITSTFTSLKDGAVKAFQAIKAGIGSTGIGVLVLALGAVVAYWDDIKEAVSGVSSSQKDLLESTKADAKAQQDKLSTIDSQDNVLKLQGKSEKEILGLKIKQTGEVISATERQVAQQKIVLQAQLSAEKRNKEILQGILKFVTLPLQTVIDGVNQVAKVFGKGFEFNVADKLSGLVFDPKETEKKGQEEIAALDKTLGELKNKKAGYQLSLQGIDKQGASAASANATKTQQEALKLAEEKAAAEKEALIKLSELRNQIFLSTFKNENDKKAAELNLAFIKEKDSILANTKITEDTRNELILNARKKLNLDLDALKLSEKEKKDAEDKKLLEDAAIQLEKDNALEFEEVQKAIAKNKENNDKIKADNDAAREAELQADIALQNAKFEAATAGLNLLASLAGQNEKIANAIFVVDKALAIARIVIDTQREIAGYAANPTWSALPDGGIILKSKAILTAKLRAATSVASIVGTTISKFKGGGSAGSVGGGTTGGGAPGVSSAAPMSPPQPQAQTTTLDQNTINAMGNQTTRAYVVESDVTDNQQRIAAIQQRARFG